MLTKQFMGQSLKAGVQPAQAPRAAPVQTAAFFKKAEKSAKRAAAPLKGNATQVESCLSGSSIRGRSRLARFCPRTIF